MWQLADYAESHGVRESALLGLADAGCNATVCLDFDLSIRSLKRWAEERANETVWETAPKQPEGKTLVPRFKTLADVLGLDSGNDTMVAALTPDPEMDAKAAELQAAFNRGDVDWRTLMGIE